MVRLFIDFPKARSAIEMAWFRLSGSGLQIRSTPRSRFQCNCGDELGDIINSNPPMGGVALADNLNATTGDVEAAGGA
jgi:hypothetical protein